MIASTVSPYLRFSFLIRLSRSSTCCRRRGLNSIVSRYSCNVRATSCTMAAASLSDLVYSSNCLS